MAVLIQSNSVTSRSLFEFNRHGVQFRIHIYGKHDRTS